MRCVAACARLIKYTESNESVQTGRIARCSTSARPPLRRLQLVAWKLCTQEHATDLGQRSDCIPEHNTSAYTNKLCQPHKYDNRLQQSLYQYKLTGTPLDPAKPGTPILPYSHTTGIFILSTFIGVLWPRGQIKTQLNAITYMYTGVLDRTFLAVYTNYNLFNMNY